MYVLVCLVSNIISYVKVPKTSLDHIESIRNVIAHTNPNLSSLPSLKQYQFGRSFQ